MKLETIIKWTNDNSGFLSLILFIVTIVFGWISGIFQSIIKKPKLKIRLIEKASFYSFFYIDEVYNHPETDEMFNIHQTAFAVYMSISNVGNIPTSIDKIYLGYYKNTIKQKWFNRQIVWLPQLHVFDDFKFEFDDKLIIIPPLRSKTELFFNKDDDWLEVGKSVVGIAYFEQDQAWGNMNPQNMNGSEDIDIVVKIRDVYGKNYKFKLVLKAKSLKDAIKINSKFGKSNQILRFSQS